MLLSVAPMMDITDRHFRWMMRQISRRVWLYTEMVTTGALLHGDRRMLLGFDPEERPLALQLGGDDPQALATCARMAEDEGYDEVNLNVGCPSPRVARGNFGVCLMGQPGRVADAVAAMRSAVRIPVTVKHRIGFDDLDRYEDMLGFVDTVASAGCSTFIVHARKAWLSGLSPKDNRTVPPLRHDDVWRLKRDRPILQVVTNGGLRGLGQVREQLDHTDGVMIGRAAAEDPLVIGELARELLGEEGRLEPVDVAWAMLPYVRRWEAAGAPGRRIVRHLLPVMAGRPGARAWRRTLTEGDGGSAALIKAIGGVRTAEDRGADPVTVRGGA